jgi:hypothetical protein
MDWLVELLGGATGAAAVAGVFSLVQSRKARKERQEDKRDAHNKALRYLMLYIIQERAKAHIKDGSITLEERRSLHHWHDLYHNGLGGNGDADALMEEVDHLPLDTEN